MFRAAKYLGDIGVPFWTSGKNVSEGWVSIQCPLCGDKSNHGGFSPSGNRYSCFKCGASKSPLDMIALFSGVSFTEAKGIIGSYSSRFDFYKEEESKRATSVEWPPSYVESELPSIHAQYLHSRGYDVKRIREQYGITGMYTTGDFKYRILIPVYMNGRVVTYVGRDVTDKQPLPYKNLKEEKSIYPAKECVYNLDNVGKRAIISEGIFDSWRFRLNGVSLFGLVFTRRQVQLLCNKLDEAYICFDNEPQAIEQAERLAQELSLGGVSTEILLIDQSDPGLMSQEEADELIQEIFGDNYE